MIFEGNKKKVAVIRGVPFGYRHIMAGGLPSPTGSPAQAASAADPPQEALLDAPFQTPIEA